MKIFLTYTVFAVNLRQFQNGEIQSLNQQNYVFLNLGKCLKVADTIFVVADLFPFFAFVLELCLWLEQLIQFMPQPKESIFSCGNASPYLFPGPGYRVYYILYLQADKLPSRSFPLFSGLSYMYIRNNDVHQLFTPWWFLLRSVLK